MTRGLAVVLVVLGIGLAVVTVVGVWAAPERDGGEPLVEIPRVVGEQRGAAERRVREAGFEPVVSVAPSARPRGTVYDQQPPAGERIERGKVVFLDVSAGEETLPPPIQSLPPQG